MKLLKTVASVGDIKNLISFSLLIIKQLVLLDKGYYCWPVFLDCVYPRKLKG